jgi:hypothetical protein
VGGIFYYILTFLRLLGRGDEGGGGRRGIKGDFGEGKGVVLFGRKRMNKRGKLVFSFVYLDLCDWIFEYLELGDWEMWLCCGC